MLKLEKVSRSRDINISVRKKNAFFNTTFMIALGSAIGAHFVFLVLFHITPFHISYKDGVIPPSIVATDLRAYGNAGETLADTSREEPVPVFLKLPIKHEPTPPAGIQASPLSPIRIPSDELAARDITQGNLDWHSPSLDVQQPATYLVVSGSLASRQLSAPPPVFNEPFSESIDVEVDDHTGQICWFKQCSPLIENYLKTVRFTPLENSFTTSGRIELGYHPHD